MVCLLGEVWFEDIVYIGVLRFEIWEYGGLEMFRVFLGYIVRRVRSGES